MKVLFMGTPDFSVGILKSIYESSEHQVVAVVTQPDKPKGRSDKMIPSPVKEYALAAGIPVMTPVKIKSPEAVEELRHIEADIFVVAAFGQILSKEILDMPKYGCINVHASLLPRYRGAAPIQWAIADGNKETGITIMQMNEGLDTGDILFTKNVAITSKETGESLFDKLMKEGADFIITALDEISNGNANPVPQDESKATYARILKKEMGLVNFASDARSIDCLIRAFTPWPGGYTYLDGKILKIKEEYPIDNVNELPEGIDRQNADDQEPGVVVGTTREEIIVACGYGFIALTQIQPEGKKAMSVHDYLLGKHLEAGTKLG